LSVIMELWGFVVKAFLEWRRYEVEELGPQTVFLSPSEAQKMSTTEFRWWCEKYRIKFLAERMKKCDKLSIALEDLKGSIRQEEIMVLVDGMIRLCDEIKRRIGEEIDAVSDCIMEIGDHVESFDSIRKAGEVEEEIRKLMANFKIGFDHMEEFGFPPPEYL